MSEGDSCGHLAKLLYSCSSCGLPESLSAKLISSQVNPCIFTWTYSVPNARLFICLGRISQFVSPFLLFIKFPLKGNLVEVCFLILWIWWQLQKISEGPFCPVIQVPNENVRVLKPLVVSWPLVCEMLTFWAWRQGKILAVHSCYPHLPTWGSAVLWVTEPKSG